MPEEGDIFFCLLPLLIARKAPLPRRSQCSFHAYPHISLVVLIFHEQTPSWSGGTNDLAYHARMKIVPSQALRGVFALR